MATKQIIPLFLDIGGVLLANGWDHHLKPMVFYQPRDFTPDTFKASMYA
jgi:hypothetical protein